MRAEDWMDRSLLTIQQDQIASIAIGDVVLERKDGKYVLAGLAKDQKQDETATYGWWRAHLSRFRRGCRQGRRSAGQVNEPDVEASSSASQATPSC